MEQEWWVVYTLAGKEPLVDLCLREQEFETYFPYSREWVPSEKSKLKVDLAKVAYLTRYLFVKATELELGRINLVMGGGMAEVIPAPGGDPFPIPEAVMQDLKRRLGPTGQVYRNAPPKFAGGDRVKGREGWPHWGLLGSIARICGDYALVEMKMLGSKREIMVPVNSIDLLNDTAA